MVDADLELNATVLKVGHHGSSTSTHAFFLDAVEPEVAVIQVGDANRYGHPHTEVLDALEARAVSVYRTDIHGNIVIVTDGKSYSISVTNEQPRAPPESEQGELEPGQLNMNTASAAQLESLWDVGPAIAERIVEYREKHGPFTSKEEIVNVEGIDEGKFKRWNDEITI